MPEQDVAEQARDAGLGNFLYAVTVSPRPMDGETHTHTPPHPVPSTPLPLSQLFRGEQGSGPRSTPRNHTRGKIGDDGIRLGDRGEGTMGKQAEGGN